MFILPIGLWDLRDIVEAGDIVPGFRSILRVLEKMEYEVKVASQRLGKPVNQVILIFDFQQFSYRQLSNRTVNQGAIEFFRIFEANYPELVKICMFINTPRIFPLFFSLLKPFISSRTMSKMEFYGPHKNKWMTALLRRVPMENLPPHYGGTREGKDEFCSDSSIWNDGEPLPPNYYGGGVIMNSAISRRNSITDPIFQNGGIDGKKNCREPSLY